MKKIFIYLLSLLTILTLTGCISGVGNNIKKSSDVILEHTITPEHYDVLGRVEYQSSTTNVLWLFWWGNNSYSSLLAESRRQYGADEVINIRKDTLHSYFFGIWNKQTYIYSGLAIKYKNMNKGDAEEKIEDNAFSKEF